MPFITQYAPERVQQMSFDDLMSSDISTYKVFNRVNTNTVTRYYDVVNPDFVKKANIPSMLSELRQFRDAYAKFFEVEDLHTLYDEFRISKKSGGFRKICAPQDEFKAALRVLKIMLERWCVPYHTSAFAYVAGRNTVSAIRRHQQNESKWFLKLDFHDFFGSTTPDFVSRMFKMIFPFSEIMQNPEDESLFNEVMSLCFLDGGLPQGTPTSPVITNIMMIPIDYTLSKELRDFDKFNFVYTRYADDMQISCKHSFRWKNVQDKVKEVCERVNAPFSLNEKKTRYGSSAGSNWNLGIMLNKDNNMTIGWENKIQFRHEVYRYARDRSRGKYWQKHDIQVLRGNIAYYESIEGDTIKEIVRHYGRKFNLNILSCIKSDLKR